jgi:hypothetical protein
MTDRITIDRRFRGPPDSGNGGYVCGRLAAYVDGAAEVTLRRPPPLDRPLDVQRLDGGSVAVLDGDTLVAEGAPASLEIEIPEPVTAAEAERAARSFLGFRHHPFPTCFVCGPKRAERDGLRIFPGRIPGRNIVAAPWTPDASLADKDGQMRPEIVWAALDCPSGFAVITPATVAVLGRLAVKLVAPVQPGKRYVAIGWPLGEDGRKLYAGAALFSQDGRLRAFARATWIRTA